MKQTTQRIPNYKGQFEAFMKLPKKPGESSEAYVFAKTLPAFIKACKREYAKKHPLTPQEELYGP